MGKLRIGLVFGGRSVEHEVSLASAKSILDALDANRYEVVRIAVGLDGRWHLGSEGLPLAACVEGAEVSLPAVPTEHTLVPTERDGAAVELDVVFPIIHGRGGEDGSLQGLLELADVAYVGSGVLGSALQMDKEVSKRLLLAAGLPVTPWLCVRSEQLRTEPEAVAARVLTKIGLPVFVKPANQGSSIGISRVGKAAELLPALTHAARFDTKLLAEQALDAREIEVALLGNDPIEASVPGEIRTGRDFYDYEAKYHDSDTELLIPAPLDADQTTEVRRLAVEATQALEGAGLARVDFLLDRTTGQFFINEVNSLPGFTEGSMYPKLWEASGLSYSGLLDRLIELAITRHGIAGALETRYLRDD
jgi:D-alanine-D-alanine ligase